MTVEAEPHTRTQSTVGKVRNEGDRMIILQMCSALLRIADHASNYLREGDRTRMHLINSKTTNQHPTESFYDICVNYSDRQHGEAQ